MNYTVYIHVCPNNKRYVGITCQRPQARWNGGKKYKQNKHFFNAILKYGWNNIEHIIVATNLSKDKACKLEQGLIKKYKTTNRKYGYNKSAGGECSKLGVSNTHYNTRRNNPASRKVLCLELNIEFETMTDAYEKLKVDVSAITKCCKGKRKTAGRLSLAIQRHSIECLFLLYKCSKH